MNDARLAIVPKAVFKFIGLMHLRMIMSKVDRQGLGIHHQGASAQALNIWSPFGIIIHVIEFIDWAMKLKHSINTWGSKNFQMKLILLSRISFGFNTQLVQMAQIAQLTLSFRYCPIQHHAYITQTCVSKKNNSLALIPKLSCNIREVVCQFSFRQMYQFLES